MFACAAQAGRIDLFQDETENTALFAQAAATGSLRFTTARPTAAGSRAGTGRLSRTKLGRQRCTNK